MKKMITFLLASGFLLLAVQASAQIPVLINFQGKLTDLNQVPTNVTTNMTFSIYNDKSVVDGILLWKETHPAVQIKNGIFDVVLGSGTPETGTLSAAFTGANCWLEVQVGADVAMTPRQQMTSVGYSIHAGAADDVPNKDITPKSVSIFNVGEVIDSNGQWVGDPTGLVGPEGPQGPAGADGAQGDTGPTGAKGERGLQGAQGTQGATGPQGPQGSAGPQGSSGAGFPGYINVGLNVSSGYGQLAASSYYPSVTCTPFRGIVVDCKVGKDTQGRNYYLVAGGAYCAYPAFLRETRPSLHNTWRIACTVPGSGDRLDLVAGAEFIVSR